MNMRHIITLLITALCLALAAAPGTAMADEQNAWESLSPAEQQMFRELYTKWEALPDSQKAEIKMKFEKFKTLFNFLYRYYLL